MICDKLYKNGHGNRFRCGRQKGHKGPHGLINQVIAKSVDLRSKQEEADYIEQSETEVAQRAVRALLSHIGEDPERDGLLDTPKRVVKALKEMTVGYSQDPAVILERDFHMQGYDEMIAVPNVEFYSMCEHHMLSFFGVAHVAYLPGKKASRVVGLSKLARLVDCFAKRLQIQEKLTAQIADAIEEHLDVAGVAVVVQAKHLCMCARGVQKHKASMVTSAMRGAFRSGPARQEFLSLVAMRGDGL